MDVMESISLVLTCLQCCNLSRNAIDRTNWTPRPSRLLQIYCISVLLISLAMLIYGLFGNDELLNKSADNEIGLTVDSIQMFGIRVAHLVTIAEAYAQQKGQGVFMQQVREIDRIFECSLNVDVDNRGFRRLLLRRGAIMFGVYFCSELLILTSHLVAHNQNFLLYWLLYLFPFFICGLRYFQIFATIMIIRHRLDKLVNVLNEVNLLQSKSTKTPSSGNTNSTSSATVHLISNTLPLYEGPDFACNHRYDMENPDMKRLLIVRDLYNRLWELTGVVNSNFGASLLVNVGNDFICITSNCYWIFLNFKDYTATLIDLLRILSSVVWFVPHLFNVLVLALLCDRTVQRTTAIALGLHRIETNIWNDNHNTVIEQFSLQLLHQKLAFSAAGFFDINCTLLYTIAGATTTYLIILIQFHMSEQKINNS